MELASGPSPGEKGRRGTRTRTGHWTLDTHWTHHTPLAGRTPHAARSTRQNWTGLAGLDWMDGKQVDARRLGEQAQPSPAQHR
jgi:hypothetical protein